MNNPIWKPAILTGLILISTLAGCRSPQTVLENLHQTDPSFVAPVSYETTASETSETGSVEDYVQMGITRNPRIQEAHHRIDSIGHRLPQVMSLPDPMVNTNTHLAPVQTAAGRQTFSLGISQKITNAERRATQAAIVSDELAAAEAALKQTELQIANEIRTACYQLLFIRKSIEITRDDFESLEQIADMVLREYEVKRSVTQQDVLNIQTEQSKLENQITALRQKEKSFHARLARLLHVDPNSELQITDQLEANNTKLNVDQLIAQALQSRPDLQSQMANIRRDSKKVHLAKLEAKPDLTVGLNWIATSSNGISPVANGDDALILGVGFNLPVYQSRIRAGICEAHSNRLASESRLASLHDQTSEEVFDLIAKLDSTMDTLTLIQEDIIPKAERTLEISLDAYSTASITYVQLITNWRNVLRYRITEANLQSEFHQTLAALAQSVGQLERIEVPATDTPPVSDQANPE